MPSWRYAKNTEGAVGRVLSHLGKGVRNGLLGGGDMQTESDSMSQNE